MGVCVCVGGWGDLGSLGWGQKTDNGGEALIKLMVLGYNMHEVLSLAVL